MINVASRNVPDIKLLMTQPKSLIVIGSSAGGVEALSTLVAGLPNPFPAPIVIAQHLDPNRQSHLVEILSRRATLKVSAANNGDKLVAGNVYVIPSNRHVEIKDHTVTLLEDNSGNKRPKPSVDLLLKTAAASYGESLVAVILTGTGNDGTAGAREVKRAGGTVVIQNPETASFPSMPESLAPSTVDVVADIGKIGPLLRDLVNGEYEKPPSSHNGAMKSLLEQVREQSGIDFTQYKTPTIERRLRRRIVATECENIEDYIRYLSSHPEEYQKLVNSFLIKVTEFRRDPELYRYLRENLLPEIIRRARETKSDIRIWSAGCATGEEAYSMAIELCELLGDDASKTVVRIFATDIDSEAISFARKGVYPLCALEDLPPEIVNKYFTRVGESFQVRKMLRSMTVFGEHDLGQRAPFPNIDVILCRNVMIYFTHELQRRTLQIFAFSLRRGGYLVLGKAETTSPKPEFFTPFNHELKIYQRHGNKVLVPPARITTTPAPQAKTLMRSAEHNRDNVEAASIRRELQSTKDSIESTLQIIPVGVVLVNRRYDILEINAAARKLLGIHSPAIGEDFIHLTQNVSHRSLRSSIDAVFRGEPIPPIDTVKMETVVNEKPLYINVTIFPHTADPVSGKIESAVIIAVDVTSPVEKQLDIQKSRNAADEARQHAEAMMERLSKVNRELIDHNEELTESNQKLQVANEDLLLRAEEAQAATEEVETLNEELQSSNEELETLNEELQATIEELNTTNADLEARSRELQELTKLQERFVAMSSHELRTPLVPLQGSLELLLKLLPEGPKNQDRAMQLASTALAQLKRLTTLVNDLLDATRLQSGKFQLRKEHVDMNALVARTVEIAQAFTRQQTIIINTPQEALYVDGDALRLEQVIFNLLSNAITHAGSSKRIDVRLSRFEDKAKIEVQDFGSGIAKADQQKVFTSFYQVTKGERPHDEGLGLGLFICKEIVNAHLGSILIESDVGKGTTFIVTLPLAAHPEHQHD
jgi:two-component system, chemotaxis family, CheB/CheR fusion protein